MNQPIQNDYKRLTAIHSLYQIVLVGSAIAVTCGSLALTQTWKNRDSVRAACALVGVGLCLIADAERKDKKWSEQTAKRVDEVLSYNAAAWTNALTRPSESTMRLLSAQSHTPGTIPLFDWSDLQDPDEHPTFAIISPMGGGKSRLAKYLTKHVLFPGGQPSIQAIDIYGRKKDWQEAELVTEHNSMLKYLESDLEEIESRVSLYRSGQDDFQPIYTILEEAPDTLRTLIGLNGGKDLVNNWVTKRTTVARKVKSRLCLVSVRLSGAEIGVSAEARNDSTVIFPGAKGIAKAMSDDRIFKLGARQNQELREQLQASLNGVKRPALIYSCGQWFPASIPELDPEGNPPGVKLIPPGASAIELSDVEKLNRMYEMEWNVSPRVNSDKSELQEKLGELNENSRISQLSAIILNHLREKQIRFSVDARMLQKVYAIQQSKASADDIREAFQMLQNQGLGVCEGEGNSLRFRALFD